MNRKIKFRAEDFTGKWNYGFIVKGNSSAVIIPMMRNGSVAMGINVSVKPETICQFTGLYDKNGNEIYDKDIVGYGDKGVFMVCYNKDCCQFEFRTTLCDGGFVDGLRSFNSNIYVVLGNVFDNPELLKNK